MGGMDEKEEWEVCFVVLSIPIFLGGEVFFCLGWDFWWCFWLFVWPFMVWVCRFLVRCVCVCKLL